MTAAREPALHHGWVVVSYFLIFGGLFLSAVVFAAFDFESSATPYVVCIAGALIGGWFTGRLSPYRRLNEPLTASVVMTVSIVACTTSTALGPAIWQEPALVIVRRSLILGGCALVGTLLGALLGRARLRRLWATRSTSGWHYAGLSFLLTLGAMGIAFLVWFGLLRARNVPGAGGSTMTILAIFSFLAGASALGGFMTQLLCERRMSWICGLGGALCITLLGALGALHDGDKDFSSLFFGALGLATMYWPVGRLGAGVGWRVQQYIAARRAQALPDAQAL